MKVNTIIEFRSFINELDLESGYAKDFLYIIFKYKDKRFYILDLEKRQVICTSQTFSSDGNGLLKRTILYELYIETYSMETYSNNKVDTMVLTFKTLEDLKKSRTVYKR